MTTTVFLIVNLISSHIHSAYVWFVEIKFANILSQDLITHGHRQSM